MHRDISPISHQVPTGNSVPTGNLEATSHLTSISHLDHIGDPLRDLNNRLQGHPKGNLTSYLSWALRQEGPGPQRIHFVTARCESVSVLRTTGMC
jgi:hypothetical protein